MTRSRSEPRVMLVGGKDGPVPARHIGDWSSDVAEREALLEAAYAKELARAGSEVRCQVRTSSGIADIVTDDAVIEVKLWLTRSALFSAVGQATVYASELGKARRVVMGYEAGAPDALVAAIGLAGVEVVSWIAAGGPDWTDYTQTDDYEGPENDVDAGDTEDWGEDE